MSMYRPSNDYKEVYIEYTIIRRHIISIHIKNSKLQTPALCPFANLATCRSLSHIQHLLQKGAHAFDVTVSPTPSTELGILTIC